MTQRYHPSQIAVRYSETIRYDNNTANGGLRMNRVRRENGRGDTRRMLAGLVQLAMKHRTTSSDYLIPVL